MATDTSLITGGLIDIEVKNIINTANNDKDNIEYEVILHTEEIDLTITNMQYIEVLRDYNANIGDYVVVKFNLPMGTYVKQVYPYRDNLELTVIKSWKDNSKPTITTRYKLILFTKQGAKEGSYYTKATEEELNTTSLQLVEGQCLLRELEGIRTIYVDGIYKNVTVQDVIEGLFADGFSKIQIEGNPLDVNLEIYPCVNDYTYKNLIVPTGINLSDLPSYLQLSEYGVYNGSIGTYYQNYSGTNILYVYPLYDITRYEQSTLPTLTIYHANTAKLDFVENTYKDSGGDIKLLAGNNISSRDVGSNKIISDGDGLIYSNASELLNRNFELTDDGINFDNTKQMTATNIVDRRDGQVRGRYAGVESNMYRQRSKTLADTLSIYIIPWQFSNPDILYPGMPCCFVYEDSRQGIVKLTGTLQGVFTRYDFVNKIHQSLVTVAVKSPNVYNTEDEITD